MAIFLLMLRCGLRVGEIRNLSLNDLFLYPMPGNLPRIWLIGKGMGEGMVRMLQEAQP